MKNRILEEQISELKQQVSQINQNFVIYTQQTTSLINNQQRLSENVMQLIRSFEIQNNNNQQNLNLHSNNPNNNTVVVINNNSNQSNNDNTINNSYSNILDLVNKQSTEANQLNSPNPDSNVRREIIDGTLLLRNDPRKPPMSANCPPTWILILDEWQRENLGSFENPNQKLEWSLTDRSRYARRLRFIKQIHRLSYLQNIPMDVAANNLDVQRNLFPKKTSMSEHLSRLESNDSSIKKRNR